jgi:hypothetical protein
MTTNAAREALEAFVDKTILKQRSEALAFAAGVRDRNTRDKAVAAILAAADVYARAVAEAARAEGDEPDSAPDVKVWSRKLSTGVRTYRWVLAGDLEAHLAEVAADPDRELIGHDADGEEA